MVDPTRIHSQIIGNNVFSDKSGTHATKHSFVSQHMPPNTHCCGSIRPALFLRLTNKLSSISTIQPTPPILESPREIFHTQTSLIKLFQSTAVDLLIPNSRLQKSTDVSS
ncbi:unnamed protein product [Macrosiphum euphorbiae]|uniref:Uncharacterized protein n=1 Tax=Macrosiphum euphorbiae TaxID=13131 RepID=A0AAV0WAI0_9HEMI|nr:unnamed protein product [Macrosiphum euphorbiae]